MTSPFYPTTLLYMLCEANINWYVRSCLQTNYYYQFQFYQSCIKSTNPSYEITDFNIHWIIAIIQLKLSNKLVPFNQTHLIITNNSNKHISTCIYSTFSVNGYWIAKWIKLSYHVHPKACSFHSRVKSVFSLLWELSAKNLTELYVVNTFIHLARHFNETIIIILFYSADV